MIEHFNLTHDHSKTGYYAGLLTCALMLGRTIGSPFWGWVTDTWGRRPVLLCSLAITAGLSLAFGFAVNFEMAVGLRFATGALAPISVVTKTCVSEVCSESQQARGMAFYSTFWLFGTISGSIIGGLLSDPQGMSEFLDDWPYLLPNVLSAVLSLCSLIGAVIWFDETLHPPSSPSLLSTSTLSPSLRYSDLLHNKTITLLLGLYGINSFNSTAYNELFPLWCWARRDDGGLNFSMMEIGYAMAGSYFLLVLVQQWTYRKLARKKGYLWCTTCGSVLMSPVIFAIPWISYTSIPELQWTYIIALSMAWYFLCFQVLTSQFVMTNNTVLRSERGKLNGLCMTVGSLARALAPLCMGLFFASTATSGLPFPVNYTFCFTLLSVLSLAMAFLSRYIPKEVEVTKESLVGKSLGVSLEQKTGGDLEEEGGKLPGRVGLGPKTEERMEEMER